MSADRKNATTSPPRIGTPSVETTALSSPKADTSAGLAAALSLGGNGSRQRGFAGYARSALKDHSNKTLTMKITSVIDVYKQVRILVGMISNVWSWNNSTTTLFRLVLPGLAKVNVGQEVWVLPGFLVHDLETFCTKIPPPTSSLSRTIVTDPSVQELFVPHHSPYFKHIVVLLKLRWLLRLHSACCELDYKMCSLKNLIMGVQHVVLQQHADVDTDNIFDTKVSQHSSSHLNLESVIDDIADQLQKSLGSGWRGFLEFVSSCDPSRSLHQSKLDLSKPQIISNEP